jgi:SOS-response transcriptional repressor LexA
MQSQNATQTLQGQNMSAFTQRMQECLHFIEHSVAETGISPTMQEICAGVGLSEKSKAYASALVRSLEDRGAVRRVRMPDGKIARRGIVVIRHCCPHCGESLPPGCSAPSLQTAQTQEPA